MRTIFTAVTILSLCALALAMQTDNLSHAIKHHSSLTDAPHHQGHGRTGNWLLFGARRCGPQFAHGLQSQLTAGRLTLVEHKSGACVLRTDDAIDHNQLTTVLMSEQRAGRLDAFHRERVAKFASH